MGTSLPLRLVLTYCGVSLAALALVGSIFTAVLASSARSVRLADMRAESTAVAREVDAALIRGASPSAIQRLLERDSVLLSERMVLLNAQGEVRFDSARSTPFSTGRWRLVDMRALRHGRSAQLTVPGGVGLQVPLVLGGRAVGALTLAGATARAGVPWADIVPSLVRALAALVVIWLVIAVAVARSLTRPLRHLSQGLVSVKQGQLDTAVPEQGWSEARRLARSYNEMVAEVARSRQIQRDFVANAAHELKTPVALVSGFARSLSDGTAVRGGAVDDAVEYIRRESEHLGRIIDQLFALARLDADTNPLVRDSFTPADLLSGIAARFGELAAQSGVALHVDTEPGAPPCRWDRDLIESAVSNLVDNALEHSGSKAIYLSASRDGAVVVLEVSDTGKGIPPDDIPRLFDRFYRGHGRPREGHAGLGLALVKEIVGRHGGSVAVTSHPGTGTCFRLTLPIDDSALEIEHESERRLA